MHQVKHLTAIHFIGDAVLGHHEPGSMPAPRAGRRAAVPIRIGFPKYAKSAGQSASRPGEKQTKFYKVRRLGFRNPHSRLDMAPGSMPMHGCQECATGAFPCVLMRALRGRTGTRPCRTRLHAAGDRNLGSASLPQGMVPVRALTQSPAPLRSAFTTPPLTIPSAKG